MMAPVMVVFVNSDLIRPHAPPDGEPSGYSYEADWKSANPL
jgi:hypothetical protein